MDPDKWIAVDFDGTLATHKKGSATNETGRPIPLMKQRVLDWHKAGKTVKIFTGRLGEPGQKQKQIGIIKKWLKANGLPDLEVTNIKDHKMEELWDDRAIGIKKNTGEIEGPTTLKAKARKNLK